MEVQLLETNRHSFVKPERQGSLYDETPLFGKLTQYIYYNFFLLLCVIYSINRTNLR